jgi:hypothetical protein
VWELLSHPEEITRAENGVLRIISGTRNEEERERWRQLQSDDLHVLYPSPNIIVSLITRSPK